MTRNAIIWIFGLLIVGGIAWLIFGNKPNTTEVPRKDSPSIPDSNSSTESNPIPKSDQSSHLVNQVRKNSNGTLSLVGINSITGIVASTRDLSFEEAIKIVGTAGQVCSMASYEACKAIRKA